MDSDLTLKTFEIVLFGASALCTVVALAIAVAG